MKNRLTAIIAALFLMQGSFDTHAQSSVKTRGFMGVVTHVSDGDTLWIARSKGSTAEHVRIYGIDAPEICQDYGVQAQSVLINQLLNQTVKVNTKTRDKYGRLVASIDVGGQDLGAWLVAYGIAWSYHSARGMGPYKEQEMAARQAGSGLWAFGSPVEPKVFRKQVQCKH
jgi:micrococcal nuclease